jgi:hypothetical protein
MNDGKRTMDEIRAIVGAMTAEEKRLLDDRTAGAAKAERLIVGVAFLGRTHVRGSVGPDPRKALWPAATPAAQTGRTHDRTRPMLQQRQKVLAKAPSTHDP